MEQNLIDAFNDCIDRLNLGQSAADCVRQYPQHADVLEPMLETGLALRRLTLDDAETLYAQDRARFRFEQALAAPLARATNVWWRRFMLAASVLVVAGMFIIIAAQNSLPGDGLYGVKRFSEDVGAQILPDAQETINQRRIDEVFALAAQRRQETVVFTGVIDAIEAQSLTVETMPIQVERANLALITNLSVGERVEVTVETTRVGQIILRSIRPLAPKLPTETPPPTRQPAPTTTPTSRPTQTPASTPSPTPTLTVTSSPPPRPTSTPSNTARCPSATKTAAPEGVRSGATMTPIQARPASQAPAQATSAPPPATDSPPMRPRASVTPQRSGR